MQSLGIGYAVASRSVSPPRRRGAPALADEDAARAAAGFRSALELWRGDPLSDVEGSVARAEAEHLAATPSYACG
jgi:Bacterial transcriptional activator domain